MTGLLGMSLGAVASAEPAPPARQAPAAHPASTAPSPRLLHELATGKRRLADVMDPSTGLLFMDHCDRPGEDASTKEDRHVCPGELAKFTRERWTEIAEAIEHADAEHLTCTQNACRVGGAGEWDPVYHFTFGPRGVRGIAIDDEVLVGAGEIAAEHARQARQLAQLAACH
ncbi:MAG TPA: hypothetical protein VH165_23215 [Kofleriaceae bacterium]|jgi:hypothetical protein|nr:hypothetical protein [Kofleriaceae bacterium]